MRNLFIVNTAIFMSVAFLHALRAAYQAPVVIGSFELPLWLSGLAVVGSAVLAVLNWKQVVSPGKVEWLKLLMALIVVDIAILLYSWVAQLRYWNISGDTFLWFVIIDLVLIGIILHPVRKHSSK